MKTRRNRSSVMKRATILSQRRKPPRAVSLARCGREQIQRRIEVGRDESVELDLIEPGEPIAQATVALGFARPGEGGHLGGHRVRIGMHVERAAVGEQGAIGRRHGVQHEPVGGGFADGGERLVDDLGHGEHGRTGVEAIPVDIEPADPAAGDLATLHDGD